MMGAKSDCSRILWSSNFKYKGSKVTCRQYLVCLVWFVFTAAPVITNKRAAHYHVSISCVSSDYNQYLGFQVLQYTFDQNHH